MTWKRICGADEVAENTVKKFDVEGIPVLLVNYGAGYRAIPPICPHMEEPLEESSVVVRCILTCTKHLWAWKLDTLEMQGETEKPLKTYELKQEERRRSSSISKRSWCTSSRPRTTTTTFSSSRPNHVWPR